LIPRIIILGGINISEDILNAIQRMLDQQAETFDEKLNRHKEDIRDDIKYQLKPINNRLKSLEDNVKFIKEDIEDIKLDIRLLKNASLELSKDSINHTHRLGD
jgi:AAA+ ATPase superfamily predicted ATPase